MAMEPLYLKNFVGKLNIYSYNDYNNKMDKKIKSMSENCSTTFCSFKSSYFQNQPKSVLVEVQKSATLNTYMHIVV